MFFWPFEGHTDEVWSVAFSPDGRRIASGARDQSIRIWDAETRKLTVSDITKHMNAVISIGGARNLSCFIPSLTRSIYMVGNQSAGGGYACQA